VNRPDTDAQDQLLQIITFGLQRAAGPYRRAISRSRARSFKHLVDAGGLASGISRPSDLAVLRLITKRVEREDFQVSGPHVWVAVTLAKINCP
jgi:hypothetical protein